MSATVRWTAPEVVHNGTSLVAGYYCLHVSSVSARFSSVPLRMSVRIYPIGNLPHLPELYLTPLLRENTIDANLYRWVFVALRSINSKRDGHFQYLRWVCGRLRGFLRLINCNMLHTLYTDINSCKLMLQ